MTAGLMNRFSTSILLGSLVLVATGCDDPLEPEEHPEAGGVIIFEAGTQNVLAVSVGRLTPFDKSITVPVGGALEVEILFLDEDDPSNHAAAFHPHEDEGESLRVAIDNESLVGFDVHGDHGDFLGLVAGTTTARIDLMHGGHSDFESGDLTIIVE